jgi:hypothetical protein
MSRQVGNPLTYMPDRNWGQYGTYAGHNLLPKVLETACERAGAARATPSCPDPPPLARHGTH